MIRTSVRLRRALVALTMTTATAATAVGVAGPAHAVTSCTTTTVVDEGNNTNNHVKAWGDFEAVHVNVKATCTGSTTDYVTTGTTTLQASTNGGASWTTVKSATGFSAAYLSFYGTNVIKRTTVFRATYTGGTDASYSFTGSQDSIVIGMIRHVGVGSRCTSRGCNVNFRIGPAASISGLYAKVQKLHSGTWRAFKSAKVRSTGSVPFFLPNGYYRLLLPSGRGFLASRHGKYHVYSV